MDDLIQSVFGAEPKRQAVGESGAAEEGALRVWWMPQIPMPPFLVPVETVEQAMLLVNTLANYDLFQFENNVKPDYCNAGGLEVFRNGEWEEWENDDGDDIDELARLKYAAPLSPTV